MDFLDTTVIVFLLLYAVLTVWAFYDIIRDTKMKISRKVLLIILVLAIPVFFPIIYFLYRGNAELEKNIFFRSH